jgi:hypothetical protein
MKGIERESILIFFTFISLFYFLIVATVVGFWCLVTMRSAILSIFEERGTNMYTSQCIPTEWQRPTSLFKSAAVAETVDNHYEK